MKFKINIKQRLLISFCSLLFFFCLNLAAYFWGKAQKDNELQNLNRATDSQITTLMLQKSISDLKKQVGLVQQMTESAGDSEISKMSQEEISIFTEQVNKVTKKAAHLTSIDSKNQSTQMFEKSYGELKTSWLKFYNLYGGPEHKKAMLTLIMEAEPASESSLMILEQLIEDYNNQVTAAKEQFDVISNLVNKISVGLFIASLIFAVFIALAVASYISKRLKGLQEGANRLKDGELEARVECDGHDELASLGSDFNSMAESLLEARNKIEAAHQETLKLQREMEQIFDTVGQAIMTFDEDLEVNELYSKETDRIMPGLNPSGKQIYDTLFDDSDLPPDIKSSIESKILLCFDNDIMQWNLTDLDKPKEFKRDFNNSSRDFKVNFRPILDAHENVTRVLCQVEDITEMKALQQEAQASGERLERIKLITNLGQSDYPNFSKEQHGFLAKLSEFIDEVEAGKVDENNLQILKRSLHTGKGNCNLLGATELALLYHISETHLKNFLEVEDAEKVNELNELKIYNQKLVEKLNALDALYGEVYRESSGNESLEIKRLSWMQNVLSSLRSIPDVGKNVKHTIEDHLMHFQDVKNMVSAESLVKNYENHTRNVARKIGVEFGQIKFRGLSSILLNDKVAECLNESLIHIVTNSVVHGYKEDNRHLLKDSKVKVDIDMAILNKKLQVTIKDHGCGIDYTKIKEKALSISPELTDEINNYTEQEVLQLIFSPNFSTQDKEDQFAGRGIGMFAVAQAIESINGSIQVDSRWKEGATITLEIPQKTPDGLNCVSIDFVDKEEETTEYFQQAS